MEEENFVKHDQGKTMLSLVDPVFIEDVGKVLTFGANKYGPHSWKKCDDINRYRNSAYRHFNSYLNDEVNDPETGLSHLSHLATNIMFLNYLEAKQETQNILFDVKNIKKMFIDKLNKEEFIIDKTNVKLVEIIGVSFIADENSIFGIPNEDYINMEIEWYNSKSLNVNDMKKTPKIWQQISDSNGFINSNYGWMIFSEENGNQYDNVLKELINNPSSRRGEMIYTRPSMHQDYNKNGMSDFCCTATVDYFIRDGILYAVVKMRSNDVIFGFKNDYAWQKYILDKLAKDLEVVPGDIIWQASSLHVYERHFGLIR